MEVITESSTGRSWPPVRTLLSSSTTFLEASSATSPKMVCLPCNHVVGAVVMKNCEPLVPVSYTHLTLPTTPYV